MKLFSYLGTEVRAHWSLAIPFIICAASPTNLLILSLCFLVVVLHEYGHIIAGKRFGIKCERVYLSVIGGAAIMDKEPETPLAQFVVASCGPLVNVALVLAAIPFVGIVPNYLMAPFMLVNIFLLAFNVIPAYPMDGGRVLHALVWKLTNRWFATKFCVALSVGLATFGILYGFHTSNYQLVLVAAFVGVAALMSGMSDEQESIPDQVDEGSGSGRTTPEQDDELLRLDAHRDWHPSFVRRSVEEGIPTTSNETDGAETQGGT